MHKITLFTLLLLQVVPASAQEQADPIPCAPDGSDTFFPRGDHWATDPAGPNFTWRVHVDGAPGLGLALTKTVIGAAFEVWNTVLCDGEAVGVTFEEGPDYPTKDRGDDINTETFNHVVYWVTEEWSTQVADPWTIALATTVRFILSEYTVSSDIEFNAEHFQFRHEASGCSPGSDTCYDLQSIALHEIGHWVGLHHVLCTDAVMYPTATTALEISDISRHEIAGVCAIYNPYPLSAHDRQWGQSCTDSNQCPGGLCFIETLVLYDYGFCTSSCFTSADCPRGWLCADDEAGSWFCKPGLASVYECGDGLDNDGDGATDYPEDSGCESADDLDESDCGDGACEGSEDCTSCPTDCVPGPDQVCCSGFILDGNCCDDGTAEYCYDGPAGTEWNGECRVGTTICQDHHFGSCVGQVTPLDERCNHLDDDCDGDTDEDWPELGQPCSVGQGACEAFSEWRCSLAGNAVCWAAEGEPVDEVCDDEVDNDCDGQTDMDDDDCLSCQEDTFRDCYDGSPDTLDVGECKQGIQFCQDGQWVPCIGQVLPVEETCNIRDDDCDGETDEDWPELGQPCSLGQGACEASGDWRCSHNGNAICWAVPGEPVDEVCDDDVDNDCDGLTDLDDDDCETCLEGNYRYCYEGPAGTQDIGECRQGVQLCQDDSWGPCSGQVLPGQELCADARDNDCDGTTDESEGSLCPEAGSSGCDSSAGSSRGWSLFILLGLALAVSTRRRSSRHSIRWFRSRSRRSWVWPR